MQKELSKGNSFFLILEDNSIITLYLFIGGIIMEFFILLILMRVSLEDMKEQLFYNFWLVLLFICCGMRFLITNTQCFFVVLCLIVLPLLIVNLKIEAIGEGDLWVMMALSLCMNLTEFMVMFYVATYSGLGYGLICRQRKIAFCPFLTLGVFIAFILEMIMIQ